MTNIPFLDYIEKFVCTQVFKLMILIVFGSFFWGFSLVKRNKEWIAREVIKVYNSTKEVFFFSTYSQKCENECSMEFAFYKIFQK